MSAMADDSRHRTVAVFVNDVENFRFEAGLTWEAVIAEAEATHKGAIRAGQRAGEEPMKLAIMWLHDPLDMKIELHRMLAQKAALSVLCVTDEWDELIRDNPPCIELRICDKPDGTQIVERRPCFEDDPLP
jgi:hypothetical protein